MLVIIDAKHTLSHFAPFHTVIKGSLFGLSLELPMDKDSPASQQLYLEVFLWSVEDHNLCDLEATVPRDVLSGSLLHKLVGDDFPSLHWCEISLSIVGQHLPISVDPSPSLLWWQVSDSLCFIHD